MESLREELSRAFATPSEPAGAAAAPEPMVKADAGVKPAQEIPEKPAPSAIEKKPAEAKGAAPLKEEKTAAQKAAPGERARDAQGRFLKADGSLDENQEPAPKPESVTATEIATAAKPLIGATQPPPTWSTAVKAKWGELPDEVRSEIIKREKDYLKGIGQHRAKAEKYDRIDALVQPFMPLIAAEGGNVEMAFQHFLNTAAVLRMGTQAQKEQHIRLLASQFGVALAHPQATPQGEGQPPQAEDPRIAALALRVEQMEAERQRNLYQSQQTAYQRQQQDQAAIDSEIEGFATDGAHPHFEILRDDMAALMAGGRAKTLQDAYEMAEYANPSTREAALQAKLADAERKRKEEEAKRLEAARNAAGSVRGSPAAGTTDGPKGTLRQELEAQFRAGGARI